MKLPEPVFRTGWHLLGVLLLALLLAGCTSPTTPPQAEPTPSPEPAALDGAWNLQSYVFSGEEVPAATGVMIFSGDRFGMIYAMGEGDRSVRAHAGSFKAEGNKLTYQIPWWVEHVDGTSRVLPDETTAGATYQISGDALTIRFDSGSVQQFKRSSSQSQDALSGAWILQDYEGGAKTGPSSGTMLFAGGHFVLIYTMRPEGGLDGRGHGGTYRLQGTTLTLGVNLDLHYVGGQTMFSEESYERETTAEVAGDEYTLTFSPGNFMKFRKE